MFPDSFGIVATHMMWKDAQPPRPAYPEVSDRVWEMIKQCWERVPSKRPTVREAVRTLEAGITISQYPRVPFKLPDVAY